METLETNGNNQLIESDGVLGNTIVQNASAARITPGKKWVFTLNNWEKHEMETLETVFKQKNIKYYFGKEVGEKGTPHLQGYIISPKKLRPSEIKGISKRIHWEKMKGTIEQNIAYCGKDGQVSTNLDIKIKRVDIFCRDFPATNLYTWQQMIYLFTQTEPDRRTIRWFYEYEGNFGKSFFAKWMYMHTNDTKVITITKSADILTAADEYTKTYIFDIPRSVNKDHYHPWNALEQLKNGFVCDAKLKKDARILDFAPPHIIVFSNWEPETKELSADRLIITKLSIPKGQQ